MHTGVEGSAESSGMDGAAVDVFKFPTSFSQRALWYIEQTNPGIRAYELANGVSIRGPLNIDKLQQALQQVADRHEALRCTFQELDGEIWQLVSARLPVACTVSRASSLAQMQNTLRDFLDERFDLANGPLFRALVVTNENSRADEPNAYFALKFHHIIVDQISIQLITDELGLRYRALINAGTTELESNEIDYADFVVWQQENITREAMADKLKFWTQQISEPVACINLPTDRPRGLSQSFTGNEIRRLMRSGLSETVRRFSQIRGISLFTTLLTAYAILLERYSNQELVLIGVPFGNRGADEELQSVVGLFINTLPIPIKLSPNATFHEHTETVRQLLVSAQANQDVPMEFVLEAVPTVRDPAYNPMYQVGFSFQPPPAVLGLEGTITKDLQLHPFASLFDIQMWVLDRGANEELGIQLWYDDTLFDHESVERLIHSFENLLERSLAQPDAVTSQIGLVDGNTKVLKGPTLSIDSNRSTVPLLLDLAGKHAEKDGDRTAIRSAQRSLTYAELQSKTDGVTRLLLAKGIQPGQRVGILLHRDIELVPAVLGTMQAGIAYVPLDPNYPHSLLGYVAEDAALAGVITTSDLSEKFKELLQLPELRIDEQWEALDNCAANIQFTADFDPETPAYVIYTSGSTGRPKGVVIPHRAAVNLLSSMLVEPGIAENDEFVAITTLSFDISVLELFAPLIVGATITIATFDQSRDPRLLHKLLQETNASIAQATPNTWRLLLDQDFQPRPGFRALCGGEALPTDLASALLKRVSTLWNMYGPTEATVWSTISAVTNADHIRIGRPIANTTHYIFDRFGNDAPVGVPGELHIGGANLALGYLNRPELTAERFFDHPRIPGERIYKTGDLVRLGNDGELEHLGRLDHQIKIRGFRVELGQIEAALNELAEVVESVVHSKQIAAGDQRLIAYVVEAPDAALTISSLRRHLREILPDYMIPQFFVMLDSLPRTPNGKIDRKSLPEPQELVRSTFEAPEGELESNVAKIWAELIGVERIGRSDNFFAAGGHSLLAVKALSQIEQATGIAFDLRMLTTRSLIELCQHASETISGKVDTGEPSSKPAITGESLLVRVKRILKG